jgi:cytochrome P450
METMENNVQTEQPIASSASCPFDEQALSWQKTAPPNTVKNVEAIERDEAGVWHIYSYEAAKALLRNTNTKQAGFNANLIERLPNTGNIPVLYQEGKEHQLQRKQTARFFTPKAVSDNYRQLMEKYSDQLVKQLKRSKQAELSDLSLKLAVKVASKVVGLTNSIPGTTRRLNAFFDNSHQASRFKWHPRNILHSVFNQGRTLAFFYLDVLPAIRVRRRSAQDDVISHLIEKNYSNLEILIECITYAAAGMITTREFICAAAWHMLEQPAMRARYLVAPEEERYEMLHEILRVEPVVSNLYRHATADIALESNDVSVTIPQGSLINIHMHSSNSDEKIVGEHPLAVCLGREIHGNNIPGMLMSFGYGMHRCPGAYLAIQETDIFLQRLLAIDTLHMIRKPSVSWDETIAAYELRHLTVAV